MFQLDFGTVQVFFQTNWGWALGLSGAVVALTAFAASILNQDSKDTIALWLMGAQSEESWARSFTALFDAVFGGKHLSIKCFLRSAIASLLAVVLIWALMGAGGTFDMRLEEGGGDLVRILGLALLINIFADYISLLETRSLLGWLSKRRSVVVQVLALLTDLVASAAIIWAAIWGVTTALRIESDSLAETLGVFSPFSILFYSTFLTSVWSWAFLASTWLLHLTAGLRLGDWSQLPSAPLRFLGLITGGVVFLGAMAVAVVLQKDEDGLTAVDRGLCDLFQGEVCIAAMRLTENEQRQLDFLLLACQSGLTEECLSRGIEAQNISPQEAVRLYIASCEGGNGRGCTNLGFMYQQEIGVARDFTEAARLYGEGCARADSIGCVSLGVYHREGIGMEVDYAEAERLFGEGCDLENATGCVLLGTMHFLGQTDEGRSAALEPFQTACRLGVDAVCDIAAELQGAN